MNEANKLKKLSTCSFPFSMYISCIKYQRFSDKSSSFVGLTTKLMVLVALLISLKKNSNKGEKKVEYLTTFDLVSDLMKFLWVHVAVTEPYCFVFSFLTVLLQDIGAKLMETRGGRSDPKFCYEGHFFPYFHGGFQTSCL